MGYCFFCCYFRPLHDSLVKESGCSGNDGAGKLFWGIKESGCSGNDGAGKLFWGIKNLEFPLFLGGN